MDLDPQAPFRPARAQDHAPRRAPDHQGAKAPRGDPAPRADRRTTSRSAHRAENGASGSLYDDVTAQIVSELEAGRIPWTQPWDAAGFAPGLPKNADTGRSYSGINILILWAEAVRGGFPAQRWLTFRQALAAGGAVRKGEKGTTIFYAARFTPKGAGGGSAEVARGGRSGAGTGTGGGGADAGTGGGGDDRSVPFLKRFTVFNVAQVEGLPEHCLAADMPMPPRETLPVAEALLAASGADIRIGGKDAYYSPSADFIALPPQQAFFAQIDFYRTALHELGHWTGHGSRLDRDQTGKFGSGAYGREELCAELASAFLCASLAIQPTVRHADYIGAWLSIMRADTRAIFKAASLASKAADYLLAFAPGCEGAAEAEQQDAARQGSAA